MDNSNRKDIIKDCLVKKKAIVFISTRGEMQWRNVTTNNPEDDIYANFYGGGGGRFFIVTPGIYSLYYLKSSTRLGTYWIDKQATYKEEPAYYSFEIKTGEVLSLGSINFSGDYKSRSNPIKIEQGDFSVYWKNWNVLPDEISPEEVKIVEVREGINDPSFYHRDCG